MATRKKKEQKIQQVETDKFDFRRHAGTFDLNFLNPQLPPMSYEDELLTAEEKTAYYEELIQNKGVENSEKISKDCAKKAAILMEKLDNLDEDESQPLQNKIVGLVSLAGDYGDPTPPDVLASQKGYDDGTLASVLSPEQKKNLFEMGLTQFKPEPDSDASPKTKNDDPDSERMRELRRKARFWKNIHAWNPVEQRAYYFCGPVKPADWTEAMFVRAQKHRMAIQILSWEIRHPMMRLLELAEMGIEDAAREAVEELEKYVRLLNLYAKINREVFKKVASRLQSWPVVYSPHPRLNQIPDTITRQIGLGAGIDFEFSPNTKWNPNDLGCKIAMHLYEHVKKMRQYPESNALSACFDKAIKLPDIKQPGAVKAWWAVAKEVLLTSFPKPEEDDTLRSLTKIKKRFKVRDKILECIENRFFSLFPKPSR